MALGTVIFTLPIALIGAGWLNVLHGLTLPETLVVYVGLGASVLAGAVGALLANENRN